MSRKIASLLCLFSAVSSGAAIAATTSTAPVAYVYVTSNYSGANNRVVGYAASTTGQLTQVPGSPFADNIYSMAVNGKYLYGSDNVPGSLRNVYGYLMESNGSLDYLGATDTHFNGNTCAIPGPVVFDHTGADLYVFGADYDCSGSDAFLAYAVNKSTGGLSYLSKATGAETYGLAFIGNNVYAYAAECIYETAATLQGYQRQSDGSLISINQSTQIPTAPETGPYCPSNAAADPTNHLAVDETLENAASGVEDQIASYTADTSNGNLTTSSTYENMPHTAVLRVITMDMAPSGTLLAVGGTNGLQIFHFNGASPLTVDTGLLTSDYINQVKWDNANHLYAISNPSGKLFVFTVTATGATQAPGSPYTITLPQTLIVQPK